MMESGMRTLRMMDAACWMDADAPRMAELSASHGIMPHISHR